MTEYVLSDETRAKFKKISTASIATALYKRSLRNQFIQGVVPVAPKTEVMVGQAFTSRYIPPARTAIRLPCSAMPIIRSASPWKPAHPAMSR